MCAAAEPQGASNGPSPGHKPTALWPLLAADAAVYDFEVQPGDVVILGTDGLLDNCYTEEIVRLAPKSPAEVAQASPAGRRAGLGGGRAGGRLCGRSVLCRVAPGGPAQWQRSAQGGRISSPAPAPPAPAGRRSVSVFAC